MRMRSRYAASLRNPASSRSDSRPARPLTQQGVSTKGLLLSMHAMSAIRNANQRFWLAFHFGRSRLAHALTYGKGYSDLYRAVQFIFATAVLVLYSRNVVSATIRTALGI